MAKTNPTKTSEPENTPGLALPGDTKPPADQPASPPPRMKTFKGGKKVGIIFSGGPAPSANGVISAASLSFLDNRYQVVGFYRGYEHLQEFDRLKLNLYERVHYENLDTSISRIRNHGGVYLKTARANPGREIHTESDFQDPQKTRRLRNILDAFEHLGVGSLISIGGDDTLKTANFLYRLGMPVIHIPKTIDNDYFGIPWTFGYWTSVNLAQQAILNLRSDAISTSRYFIVELMGRKAGWITYAAGIAGEAMMMISTEDIEGEIMDLELVTNKILDNILARERSGKNYGIITIAEGLAEKLPEEYRPTERDRHGNIRFGKAEVCRLMADRVSEKYFDRTGRKLTVTSKQIGYETRTAPPISFDVVLGSMLGYGAYKLFKQGKFGHMVSVTNNFDIKAVPFEELIDSETLLTKLRNVPKGSDFYELKEALAYRETTDFDEQG